MKRVALCIITLILLLSSSSLGVNASNSYCEPRYIKKTQLTPEMVSEVAFKEYKLSNITLKNGNYNIPFNKVTVNECLNGGQPGEPSLPYYQLSFDIPNGYCFNCVVVSCQEEFVDCCDIRIVPCQGGSRTPFLNDKLIYTPPNTKIYNNDVFFPDVKFRSSTQSHRNRDRVFVNLFPIQYNPIKKILIFNKKFTVKILMFECQNPEPPPELDPEVNNERFDMAIITRRQYIGFDDAKYDDFADYAAWRTEKGYSTKCFALEDILQDFKNKGRDTPEKIRTFIRRAMITWDIQYVLLGGNDDIIPTRMVSILGDQIACDYYYSCLDGDWDSNKNSIFGEMSVQSTDINIDLDPDVYVGRAPISTNPCDLQAFINKNMNVSQDNSILQFCTILDWLGTDTKWYADFLDQTVISSSWNKYIYHENTLFLDGYFINSKIYEHKSKICQIFSHGDYDGFYNGSSRKIFGMDDARHTINNGSFFLFSTIACCTAQFVGKECIAETWMNKLNGGPFAYVGNTFYGWYRPGDEETFRNTYSCKFDRAFYKAMFHDGAKEIGKALALGKNNHYEEILNDAYYRYIFYELMLFGDPTMTLDGDSNSTIEKPWCIDQKYINTGYSIQTNSIVEGNNVKLDACVYEDNQSIEFELFWIDENGITKSQIYNTTERNGSVCSIRPVLKQGKYWWRARIFNTFNQWSGYREDFWNSTLGSIPAFKVKKSNEIIRIKIVNCPCKILSKGETIFLTALGYDIFGNSYSLPIQWSSTCGKLNPNTGTTVMFTMDCDHAVVKAEYNGMVDYCTIVTFVDMGYEKHFRWIKQ